MSRYCWKASIISCSLVWQNCNLILICQISASNKYLCLSSVNIVICIWFAKMSFHFSIFIYFDSKHNLQIVFVYLFLYFIWLFFCAAVSLRNMPRNNCSNMVANIFLQDFLLPTVFCLPLQDFRLGSFLTFVCTFVVLFFIFCSIWLILLQQFFEDLSAKSE